MNHKHITLTSEQEELFQQWMEDGNVTENMDGTFSTQDALYRNRLANMNELRKYFYNEFIKGTYADSVEEGYLTQKVTFYDDFKKHPLIGEMWYEPNENYNPHSEADDNYQFWYILYLKDGYRFKNGSNSLMQPTKGLLREEFNKSLPIMAEDDWMYHYGEEYAKGGAINFDEDTTFIYYHEKRGNIFAPKGQIYAWLYDESDNVSEKLQSEEYNWVFYPYASQNMAWRSDYVPPLKQIWTKKFQKKHKGSEKLLGVIKAYLIEDDTKLYIDMMSVNPKKKKKGIMSAMIKNLRDIFNISQENVEFSKLTEEGEKFAEKKTYADGGSVPKRDKMFELPLEMVVYVPSTQDVDKVISVDEMDKRVDEVKNYLASKFGGYTSSDKLGGYVDSNGNLVNEDIVQVVAFSTKEAYESNKDELIKQISKWGKEWGQEAIGFEFEGDLMYVPQDIYAGGGSVTDKELVARAIEYVTGMSIDADTIQYESNRIAFKYKGKNVWTSISQKLIEDTISMHRKSLEMRGRYAGGGEVEFVTKRIVNEAKNQKNNTHFAIHKPTNSIVFSWDYKGYDKEELNSEKDHYFFYDIKDQVEGNIDKFVKSDYAIVEKKNLDKKGIDLNDYLVFVGQKY